MTRETQSNLYATILLHSAVGESFNDAKSKNRPSMNSLDHNEKRNRSALHTLCSGDVGVSLLVLFTTAAHQEGFCARINTSIVLSLKKVKLILQTMY